MEKLPKQFKSPEDIERIRRIKREDSQIDLMEKMAEFISNLIDSSLTDKEIANSMYLEYSVPIERTMELIVEADDKDESIRHHLPEVLSQELIPKTSR